MKNKNRILLTMILIFGLRLIFGQSAKVLNGNWKGSYSCLQGETGLTLKIKGKLNGKFSGVFKFYPLPSNQNPRVKSGKFSFTGKYTSSGKIIITQKKWIKQPDGWIMVDLEGELLTSTAISGRIKTEGCGNFIVIKQ